MNLLSYKCIVIKIGSSLLVNENNNCINTAWLNSLIEDVVVLVRNRIKVVLVSSGAIAYGKIALGINEKNLAIESKQAIASVGQTQLIHNYQYVLNKHDLKGAQVLLCLDDVKNSKSHINLTNTLAKLLQMNIIPIINENDSVAIDEMRYGDNDRLAARVVQLVGADALILLSDVDGFYTADPRVDSHAQLIPIIDTISPAIAEMAKDSGTNHGTGGMMTKLEAAKIAMKSGCDMLITSGRAINPITHFMTTNKGTWFMNHKTSANRYSEKTHDAPVDNKSSYEELV